jgi:hypothetical protein
VRDVWRLDLATMRWEPMLPPLVTTRSYHACCAVRGTLFVIGGITPGGGCVCAICLTKFLSLAWAARFCKDGFRERAESEERRGVAAE